jgi:transglutaminase-like putative cysteine protease
VKIKAAVLLLLLLATSAITSTLGAQTSRYAFKSTYTFENRGDEPLSLTEEDATISLFINNRWQRVSIEDPSHVKVREYEDEDGNCVAVMDFPDEIGSGETLVFSVSYIIDSSRMEKPSVDPADAGLLSDIPSNLIEAHCGETDTFRLNEEIEALANTLALEGTTVLDIVSEMIEWLEVNITYSNNEIPRYPEETLEGRRGDCDDQSILLISMLRSMDIPAFLQIGVVFDGRIESDKTAWDGHLTFRNQGIGWHGWAMVYIPPWGWLPVDLTLSSISDPLTLIQNAPEYEANIVAAYNVSSQSYIGGSWEMRDRIRSSDMYIVVEDIATEGASTSPTPVSPVYIGLGIVAGCSFIAYVMYERRRRPSTEHTL